MNDKKRLIAHFNVNILKNKLKKDVLFKAGDKVGYNYNPEGKDFGINFTNDYILMIFFKSLSNKGNKLD